MNISKFIGLSNYFPCVRIDNFINRYNVERWPFNYNCEGNLKAGENIGCRNMAWYPPLLPIVNSYLIYRWNKLWE